MEGQTCRLYKDSLEVWEKAIRESRKTFPRWTWTDENKQINNSTEGILTFKNVGHATYGSSGMPWILPVLTYPLLLTTSWAQQDCYLLLADQESEVHGRKSLARDSKIGSCCCAILSHVQLFATPRTAACEAPLSVEFSRQEYWSGLPFSTPRESPWSRDQTPCLLCLLHWQVDSLPLRHLSNQQNWASRKCNVRKAGCSPPCSAALKKSRTDAELEGLFKASSS